MDILSRELNEVYLSQKLSEEVLNHTYIEEANIKALAWVGITCGSAVVTDAADDHCYIFPGDLGTVLGFAVSDQDYIETDSSDEDAIYNLIHPEDLVDKRLLEYEFFKMMMEKEGEDKLKFIARCSIRMRNRGGDYTLVDNTTQLIQLSPKGKIWLILCTYTLSSLVSEVDCHGSGINPRIVNAATGEVKNYSFSERRSHLLTDREKEILLLIKGGKSSKMIGDCLGISVNTVNRHRQNIIAKLSVGNSVEAVTAAMLMKLI